jgi:hypothetical protein
MANFKGPLDYIDVATRIVEFREKYPDGRLRQKDVQFVEFANKAWVVYTAEAWRSADDPAPAHGTAWEPVPGPTQFTRDSELQNAETAAWGRAMVAALAVDTRKGIASSEEVRNRQQEAPVSKPDDVTVSEWVETLEAESTLAQLQAAWEQAGKAGVTGDRRVVAAKDKRKAELS